jgi:hypothetical protein
MLSARQFLSIYTDFLDSNLSVRDFCANQHMKESKFFYWQNKLKSQLPPRRGFVPVVFGNEPQARPSQVPAPVQNRSKNLSNPVARNHGVSCEISYPNGVCMKLSGLPDPELLRSLLLLTHQ